MRIVGGRNHIHADFLSGTRRLAERTGARMYLSDTGPRWRYAYRSDTRVVPLKGGERIPVGNITLEPLPTPGHTPEHLGFFVTDGAASAEPMGLLTGDFVFVGDVGRPDLLEKAVRVAGSLTSPRGLFASLQQFKALPDHLQVWPAHGAGSACGKGIEGGAAIHGGLREAGELGARHQREHVHPGCSMASRSRPLLRGDEAAQSRWPADSRPGEHAGTDRGEPAPGAHPRRCGRRRYPVAAAFAAAHIPAQSTCRSTGASRRTQARCCRTIRISISSSRAASVAWRNCCGSSASSAWIASRAAPDRKP
jgi:glyoxylase-like metal-dependent hydrolase (beta-lactamase superfamily II)